MKFWGELPICDCWLSHQSQQRQRFHFCCSNSNSKWRLRQLDNYLAHECYRAVTVFDFEIRAHLIPACGLRFRTPWQSFHPCFHWWHFCSLWSWLLSPTLRRSWPDCYCSRCYCDEICFRLGSSVAFKPSSLVIVQARHRFIWLECALLAGCSFAAAFCRSSLSRETSR